MKKCWKKITDYPAVKTYRRRKGKSTETISFGEMNDYNKQWGVIVGHHTKHQKVLAEDTTKKNATRIATKYMKEHC